MQPPLAIACPEGGHRRCAASPAGPESRFGRLRSRLTTFESGVEKWVVNMVNTWTKEKKTTFGILRQCLFFLFIVFWYFATCPDDLQHDLVQMLQLLFWFLCSRWAPFLSCFLHAPACAGHLYNHFFDNHLMVEKKNRTFAGMNWIWNVCRILQVSLWMNNILKYVQQFQQVFKTSKNILFFLTVSSSPLDPGRLQRRIRPAAVFRCRCARYRLHLFRRIPRT